MGCWLAGTVADGVAPDVVEIEAAADGAEPDADFLLEFSEVLIVLVVVAVEPDGDFPLGFSEASIVLVAGDVFALVELMFAAALLVAFASSESSAPPVVSS